MLSVIVKYKYLLVLLITITNKQIYLLLVILTFNRNADRHLVRCNLAPMRTKALGWLLNNGIASNNVNFACNEATIHFTNKKFPYKNLIFQAAS